MLNSKLKKSAKPFSADSGKASRISELTLSFATATTLNRLTLLALFLIPVAAVPVQANPAMALTSPLDYQVIQRSSKKKGIITISGQVTDATAKNLILEARLLN